MTITATSQNGGKVIFTFAREKDGKTVVGISFEWMTASQSLKAARELDQLIEEKGISPTSPRTPTSSSEDSTAKGDTTRSTTTTTTSVRTGDDSPVELYTVTAAAALLLIIWMMKKKA